MKYVSIKILFALLILAIGLSGFTPKHTTKKATVYIFLSETCPICQSYTLTLKQLNAKYESKIKFVGVFPNYYADPDSVAAFKEKYRIPFDLVIDQNAELTKHFKATITPEVFIENSEGTLLYSGRIDDSFYSVGRRRNVISSTELSDALAQIVSGNPVTVPKTQAVGCIISISN